MKIYIIPYPANFNPLYFCPRGTHITRSGLLENGVEFVDSYSECDFALLDYVPHDGEKKWVYDYIQPFERKLVCIDWIDEPNCYIYWPTHTLAYFKRSMFKPNVDPNSGQLCTSREEVIVCSNGMYPTAYCALPEFDLGENIPHEERPITIGCYLRPTCPNRAWVLEAIKNIARSLGVSYHVGEVNQSSRSVGTKCHYDNEYLQYLANTKIIVTCQPSGWEGDSRLWESLMSGALVLSDKIFTTYAGKPMNEKHILEYHIGEYEDLASRLKWAVNNLSEVEEIAQAGKKYTLENNMPRNRMKVVVNHLKGLL